MAAKARVKQTVTKTKSRQKKTGGGSGYKKCPNCGGDGRVKVRKK
jgi:hypothetical protein